MENFGGNRIRKQIDLNSGAVNFAQDRYTYNSFQVAVGGEKTQISLLGFSVLYVLSGLHEVEGNRLEENSCLHIEGVFQLAISTKKAGQFLLVTSASSGVEQKKVTFFKESQLKLVEKPWGYERWLSNESTHFAFKKIFIKSGTRTSLQFHEYKRETNVLMNGNARLFFKKDQQIDNMSVRDINLGFVDLNSVSSIDVWPLTIHRLEALSDIMLFEASTPEVNDVIRIQDDSNRANGRIESEHRKS